MADISDQTRGTASSGSNGLPPTIAKLSHDLRSPLSAVMGFAALLEDPSLTNEERADYLASIRRAADQMLATLDAAQTASQIDRPAPVQPKVKVSNILQQRRVLLADDEPRLRQLTQFCLEKGGASVVTARDGQEAVELVDAGQFDVILLDMEMPNMDGFEAAKAIRDRGVITPIVAFTAHAGEAEWQRCVAVGCTRYVSKPFEAETLIRELALAIESPTAIA